MRPVQIRIVCNGTELIVGRFVGRFVAGVCSGIVEALKAPRPERRIEFELEAGLVRLWVDGTAVPMDRGQGFAQVIVRDTLRGMLQHLKGIDPDGNVRVETTLEALP